MIWLAVGLGLILILIAALVWLRASHLVVSVQGPSMAPSYQHGERVLVRRRGGAGLVAGQVVVVDLPARLRPVPDGATPEEAMLARRVIKRVAAVAGDPVPFAVEGSGPVVPPGCLVLLGDNADASGDSRQYGYVGVEDVVGVVRRTLRSG
ncbi:S26 family signal peptidase [Luedemannella helvata]|uniref:S26 family signal peptidase n=1 Tax=Luedemannella helvata TaxID=349315 RepID=A0ABP4VTD6_9ACTN